MNRNEKILSRSTSIRDHAFEDGLIESPKGWNKNSTEGRYESTQLNVSFFFLDMFYFSVCLMNELGLLEWMKNTLFEKINNYNNLQKCLNIDLAMSKNQPILLNTTLLRMFLKFVN